jgi:single-strand DNA-binding protein
MNIWTGSGNLGRDPELRYTASGTAVCDFSIAVQGRRDDPPLWVRVTAWEKQAEACAEYLRKGSKCLVTGEVKSDTYEDRDGVKRTKWWVNARQVEFLDSKPKDDRDESWPDEEQQVAKQAASAYDDLPF